MVVESNDTICQPPPSSAAGTSLVHHLHVSSIPPLQPPLALAGSVLPPRVAHSPRSPPSARGCRANQKSLKRIGDIGWLKQIRDRPCSSFAFLIDRQKYPLDLGCRLTSPELSPCSIRSVCTQSNRMYIHIPQPKGSTPISNRGFTKLADPVQAVADHGRTELALSLSRTHRISRSGGATPLQPQFPVAEGVPGRQLSVLGRSNQETRETGRPATASRQSSLFPFCTLHAVLGVLLQCERLAPNAGAAYLSRAPLLGPCLPFLLHCCASCPSGLGQ